VRVQVWYSTGNPKRISGSRRARILLTANRARARCRCKLWTYVIPHFEQFLGELDLKAQDRQIAESKADRIARSLFTKYYPNQNFTPASYVKVGSYGKGTATKRSDLDMLFVLPGEVYSRIETLAGNKQSQLLQEVKRALLVTFPRTDLRGDGQVVIAPFETYDVDIVPAFRFVSGPHAGSYLTAHTADGGSWRLSNPVAEYTWLQTVDRASAGKATHLIKMLKAWKRECNVEMKSVCLEVAATVFVNGWENRDKDMMFYDWMVRDFFAFILNYVNGRAKPAGIEEWIPLGDSWQNKAQTAHSCAAKASSYEHDDHAMLATSEWQKIFGSQFHLDWMHSLLAGVGA
jgi:hypothetical protein